MANIVEIIKTFNVQLALKNIYSKIDEMIRKLNSLSAGNSASYEITGILTPDQINSLDEKNPLTILGPSGENKYYVVENTSFFYKSGDIPYVSNKNINLAYSSGIDLLTVMPKDIIESTINSSYDGYPASQGYNSDIVNDSLELYTSDISSGNGTINYSIKYRIITI